MPLAEPRPRPVQTPRLTQLWRSNNSHATAAGGTVCVAARRCLHTRGARRGGVVGYSPAGAPALHFPLADRLELSSRRQSRRVARRPLTVGAGGVARAQLPPPVPTVLSFEGSACRCLWGSRLLFRLLPAGARPAAPELASLGAAAFFCTGLGPSVYIVGPHTIEARGLCTRESPCV